MNTNDVRDALDEAFTDAWGFRAKTRSVMERDSARMWFDRGVKAMSEVRLRGTVTEAEVEAAGRHLGMDDGLEHWIDRDSVRTALEAARQVQP